MKNQVPFWVLRVAYDYFAAFCVDESPFHVFKGAERRRLWRAFARDMEHDYLTKGKADEIYLRNGIAQSRDYRGNWRPWPFEATAHYRRMLKG